MTLHHTTTPPIVYKPTPSDDDADGPTTKMSTSPSPTPSWHRMKWTDNMVRLLIMVVFYIGDEDTTTTKTATASSVQKKGKWKSVSRAMMDRGFSVSPQQCEDKFNDLNKRYKRVNDILGKGTACRVVENHNLLDTMDHLSSKAKEEVKKLLNSKHLFFREMCAYHNSCTVTAPDHANAHPSPAPQQHCLHSTGNTTTDGSKLNNQNNEHTEDEDDDDDDEVGERKGQTDSRLVAEVMAVVQDGTRTVAEKMHWMKMKGMQLEEQRDGLQSQSIELEKQRLKWLKYSGKKEWEMERERLVNERMKLENERMALMVRDKELDFVEAVKQQSRNSN